MVVVVVGTGVVESWSPNQRGPTCDEPRSVVLADAATNNGIDRILNTPLDYLPQLLFQSNIQIEVHFSRIYELIDHDWLKIRAQLAGSYKQHFR